MCEAEKNREDKKALLIPTRHKYECAICMLLDNEADKDITWHVIEEDVNPDKDTVVCSKCVEEIREIRKKCHQKVDNPHHNILDSFVPWFVKEMPDLAKNFVEETVEEKTIV